MEDIHAPINEAGNGGGMEDTSMKGRPIIGFTDELIESSSVEMKRQADDRDNWRYWMPWTCRKEWNE